MNLEWIALNKNFNTAGQSRDYKFQIQNSWRGSIFKSRKMR